MASESVLPNSQAIRELPLQRKSIERNFRTFRGVCGDVYMNSGGITVSPSLLRVGDFFIVRYFIFLGVLGGLL